ncbi:TlpA family protein disulfide reductase [Methylovulum psychrotolerans]|uniref:Redoxin n=1 Tax=Methylovulum psychrotolerans TaxID=1704499 RepID=A0A1Z4BVS9_9GAMM|nr:TlpA disulfide reductase family protein [Methylovulum psychrotolerans]ASF45352.1 redoxin [Methylovulum psychrotolerans]MBT9099437.1 TlpA family protein disulfide reductase [Methylovulum psychrotolerans]
MKNTGLILLAAVFALAAGILTKHLLTSLANTEPTPMPAFTLSDLAGKTHSSAEWQGKILVVNFWATWCPPCRKEIPTFVALQNQWANQGVVFLGIAIDEAKAVKNFHEDMAINYPLLLAETTGAALAREFGDAMEAVPYTVIVNQQGQIIYRKPGEVSKDDLISQITPLLTPQK